VFHTSFKEITLDAGEIKSIEVTFIPLEITTAGYIAQLDFFSQSIGEFSYKLVGKSLPPPIAETLNWTCRVGASLEKVLRISPSSNLREKALHYLNLLNPLLPKIGGNETRPKRYSVEYSSQYFTGTKEITLTPKSVKGIDTSDAFSLERDETDLRVVFKPTVFNCSRITT
jgi:hypothetical protein